MTSRAKTLTITVTTKAGDVVVDVSEGETNAELRKRLGELEYLLARYEETEIEEDVLENYEPRAVVVIVTEGKYEPTVKGPFLNRGAAELWANRYEPQPGEVVHVLETEQP